MHSGLSKPDEKLEMISQQRDGTINANVVHSGYVGIRATGGVEG